MDTSIAMELYDSSTVLVCTECLADFSPKRNVRRNPENENDRALRIIKRNEKHGGVSPIKLSFLHVNLWNSHITDIYKIYIALN